MATYTGDATIVLVDTFSATCTYSGFSPKSVAAYTVPADHFAEVFIQSSSTGFISSTSASSRGSTSAGNVSIYSVQGNGVGLDTSGFSSPTLGDNNTLEPITLDEGQSVNASCSFFTTAETASVTVLVKQYKKP
jgi:hypothetical protein